jgi:hypothetical protein
VVSGAGERTWQVSQSAVVRAAEAEPEVYKKKKAEDNKTRKNNRDLVKFILILAPQGSPSLIYPFMI